MMEFTRKPITNRYEFMYFVECINGCPNGDPDAGNAPRVDPESLHGLISDVAVKRRVRDFVLADRRNESPYGIIVQQLTNINKFIAQAHDAVGTKNAKSTKEDVDEARRWICENFFDVRTFGGVLSTGRNAGQVRGPVQLTFMTSVEPVLPMDLAITRVQKAETVKKAVTMEDYEKWEATQEESSLRTVGRKQLIPYGLYEGRGFISANLAEEKLGTGFNDEDLDMLWRALLFMHEHGRSASKGLMSTIEPIIVFRHLGTDTDEKQREKQAKLGCAKAHKLFELVTVEKRDENKISRGYRDYTLRVNASALPKGVDLGYLVSKGDTASVSWNTPPKELNWIEVV